MMRKTQFPMNLGGKYAEANMANTMNEAEENNTMLSAINMLTGKRVFKTE